MIGAGSNRKSLAYVENVAAFLIHCITVGPGVHTYNYVDKPDFSMNELVVFVRRVLGQPEEIKARVPYYFGYVIGKALDAISKISGFQFSISSIRIQKFCANSIYNTSIDKLGFTPPVPLEQALETTIRKEFMSVGGDDASRFRD
jgi:nucleoside-diphosphate-sugar epimerase